LAFHNEPLSSIYKNLNSSENGLTSSQAERNQNLFGKNELDKQKSLSFFARFFLQFKNIMIIILLISAIISTTLAIINNDYESLFEGLLIFAIVIINAIVGVIQEQKAENALLMLAKSAQPFATVRRNNHLQKINTASLVVGDVIHLKTGDRVPADIRLIDSQNLTTDESSLTGESTSVQKQSDVILNKNTNISDQSNMCFSGTIITSGKAKGIVVAVGKNTELGKIANNLASTIKEKTPLEKNIDLIGKVITYVVLAIVFIVFALQVIFNKSIMILDALLTAVALAVAAIPESLPAVITIIMALGVQKLAKRNAIIKKLSAVETLGCCNVICTDKTGTLTQNNMVINHVYESLKTFSAQDYVFSKNSKLGIISSVCSSVQIDEKSNISGDATESAITKFLAQKNVNFEKIKNYHKILKVNEFSSSRKMMGTLCSYQNQTFLYAKGAIDYILPKCTHIEIDEKIVPLSTSIKHKILKENENIGLLGERLISVAYKLADTDTSESNLIFVGFYGIIDPPRQETFSAIKQCKSAGLKTIMITGDHQTTAFAIAKKLGIAKNTKEVLTGSDLNKLTLRDLEKIIMNYSVFARVTPEHKLMIVKALKRNGNIVSMTGDGINDAPSIKNANIGVCMGKTGTDVTKEVADIIVADDNFSTIVLAIKQGRTIYQNITKTIVFLLSTNLVEVLGLFITSLIMPNTTFLSATQVLFINLVSDSLPAFALGIEPPEKNVMSLPPRDPKKSLLSGKTAWTILYQGIAQTAIVLMMFIVCTYKFGAKTANTMCFLTICLMQLIHAINCKTEGSILKINIFKNKFFNFSFISLLFLTLLVYLISPLQILFSLTTITPALWLIVIITSLSIIPIVELGKFLIK